MLVEDGAARPGRTTRELSVVGTRVRAAHGPAARHGRRALRLRHRAAGHAPRRRRALAARARDGRARPRGRARRARRARGASAADDERQAGPQAALRRASRPTRARRSPRSRAEDAEPRRAAGIAALAPRYDAARLRRRPRAGARRAAASGGSRRGRDAATSRPAWREADVIVEGEYAHVRRRCSTRSSRTAPSRSGSATSCTRLGLDAGHVRRARRSSRARFELDPDRVHVTCEFMGGGFGAKQGADDRGPDRRLALARRGRPRRARRSTTAAARRVATGHRASTQQTVPHRRAPRRDADRDRGHAVIANPMRGWVDPDHDPGAHALPLRRTCARRRSR